MNFDYSQKTFEEISWKGHEGGINGIAWSPCFKNMGSVFASTGNDKSIIFWKYNNENINSNPEKLYEIKNAHNDFIRDIGWSYDVSKNYSLLATCSEDGSVKIWNVYLEEKEKKHNFQEINKQNPVWKVSWNFMGNLLAISFADSHEKGCIEVYKQNENNFEWVCDSNLN